MKNLLKVIANYEKASCQKVSILKSEVFFSKNVDEVERGRLVAKLEMNVSMGEVDT